MSTVDLTDAGQHAIFGAWFARTEIARGEATRDGFVVFKGSLARKEVTPSLPEHVHRAREVLRKDNVLVDATTRQSLGPGREQLDPEDFYIFCADTPFPSKSAAASVVLSRNANGVVAWQPVDADEAATASVILGDGAPESRPKTTESAWVSFLSVSLSGGRREA